MIQMVKRKAVRKIIKKRQLRKQVKHVNHEGVNAKKPSQEQQQQRALQPIGLGYGHQMYGNAMEIQQLRNQNQSSIDRINSMSSTVKSLENENQKKEAIIKDLNKQIKEAEHRRDKAKNDLEITEDRANDIELMNSKEEYYTDKEHQIVKRRLEQQGENNIYQTMNNIQEEKQELHKEEIVNVGLNQKIQDNKLAFELKRVQDETTTLKTKNKAMYEYINSDEFMDPYSYLSKAYVQKMKEKEKEELMKKWNDLSKENMRMKEQLDKDYDINTDEMIKQIKNNIKEQNEIKLKNQLDNRKLINQQNELDHLGDIHRKVINETNDLELDNDMLRHKLQKLDSQPNVQIDIMTQQEKLVNTQTENDKLKTKSKLQQRTKDLQLDNSLLKFQLSKLRNDMGDEELVEMKNDFYTKQYNNDLHHQEFNEQQRHREVITSQEAQINTLRNNNINDNNEEESSFQTDNNNTEEALTTQANYIIKLQNENEEKQKAQEIKRKTLINEITEIRKNQDRDGNAWWQITGGFQFNKITEDTTLQDASIDLLEQLKNNYQNQVNSNIENEMTCNRIINDIKNMATQNDKDLIIFTKNIHNYGLTDVYNPNDLNKIRDISKLSNIRDTYERAIDENIKSISAQNRQIWDQDSSESSMLSGYVKVNDSSKENVYDSYEDNQNDNS